MKPTRASLLIGIAVCALAVGLAMAWLTDGWTGRVVSVPPLASGAIWLLAIALGAWTYLLRPRLRREPGTKPVPAIAAARTAALAMAASRTGALIAGLYAGIGIGSARAIGTPAGEATFWASVVAAAGALALILIALWLESICRIPVRPDDDPRGLGSRHD